VAMLIKRLQTHHGEMDLPVQELQQQQYQQINETTDSVHNVWLHQSATCMRCRLALQPTRHIPSLHSMACSVQCNTEYV
jgi:hypothetical protein